MTVSYPSGSAIMKSWQHAFFAASMTSSMDAFSLPNLILLAMVSANRYTFWNTKLKFFIRLSMLYSLTSIPPSFTEPSSTSQNLDMRLHKVVLPPPEGPTMASDDFSGMWRLIPSIIFLESYEKLMFSTSISWFSGSTCLPSISMASRSRIA